MKTYNKLFIEQVYKVIIIVYESSLQIGSKPGKRYRTELVIKNLRNNVDSGQSKLVVKAFNAQ